MLSKIGALSDHSATRSTCLFKSLLAKATNSNPSWLMTMLAAVEPILPKNPVTNTRIILPPKILIHYGSCNLTRMYPRILIKNLHFQPTNLVNFHKHLGSLVFGLSHFVL